MLAGTNQAFLGYTAHALVRIRFRDLFQCRSRPRQARQCMGGRRPDAELVFADAGRRAARRAVRRMLMTSRLAARAAPRSVGYAVAGRAARVVLGGDLRREGHVPLARVGHALAVHATPDGTACTLWAAAFAELLRLLAGYETVMLHTACVAAGGARCEWRAGAPPRRSRRRRGP